MCRSPWYGSNLQIQGKTWISKLLEKSTNTSSNESGKQQLTLYRKKYPCGEIVFYHGTQYGVPFDLALPPPGHPHGGGVDHMLTHVFIYVIANWLLDMTQIVTTHAWNTFLRIPKEHTFSGKHPEDSPACYLATPPMDTDFATDPRRGGTDLEGSIAPTLTINCLASFGSVSHVPVGSWCCMVVCKMM